MRRNTVGCKSGKGIMTFSFSVRVKTKRIASFLSQTIACCVIVYIFFRTFGADNAWQVHQIRKSSDSWNAARLFKKRPNYQEEGTYCPLPKLKTNVFPRPTKLQDGVYCKRVLPVRGSCDLAASLFQGAPPISCHRPGTVTVCQFKERKSSSYLTCTKGKCQTFGLGVRSVTSGVLTWREVRSAEVLTSAILNLTRVRNSGYCLIRCVPRNKDSSLDSTEDSSNLRNIQLLILPPYVEKKRPQIHRQKPNININLIFVDSVSRPHFFRSLKNTVKLFETVNLGNTASVLDYELVQAVRSRTFETLNSLLGGFVPQSDDTFGVMEMPPEPLKIQGLFKLFTRSGYETLWLEDLCFEWEWGISKDLLIHNKSLSTQETWHGLMEAFEKVGIQSFGMSSANCEILAENGVRDHFHGPDAVCFNGQHQHQYMLDYLKLYQQGMARSGNPYFTFLQTNIGHEDSGVRIQTLDKHFEKYLKFVLRQESTLTIVFSDHGNAYGQFIEQSEEGRVELYHPFVFLMVPKRLAQRFGRDKMQTLSLNQHRLISHLDLHYTIKSLVSSSNYIPELHRQYHVSSSGLFENISGTRECSNMPRVPPNLCICDGGEWRVKNDTAHVLYAHFAVGTMNNVIQQEYQQSHPKSSSSFGACQKLELVAFQHVTRSQGEGSDTFTMELLFASGDKHYNSSEIFLISVKSETRSGHLKLHKFDRLSPYGKYAKCADKGVQLLLCICDLPHQTNIVRNLTRLSQADLLMKSWSQVIARSQDCLHSNNESNEYGVYISLINSCQAVAHISLSFYYKNMVLSSPHKIQCTLRAGEVKYLLTAIILDRSLDYDLSYDISFKLD